MRARVKATGEIVEVKSKIITSPVTGESLLKYVNQKTGVSYFEEELFFPKDLADDPNYWTRLEHTYAGMAMQGLLQNKVYCHYEEDKLAYYASLYAHALVEKMKEEGK